MGGAITGDEKRTQEEKEGDRHPPHVKSPPTSYDTIRDAISTCARKPT